MSGAITTRFSEVGFSAVPSFEGVALTRLALVIDRAQGHLAVSRVITPDG